MNIGLFYNVDIDEIMLSNKFSFVKNDFKYFIGYKDDKKVKPLCIMFPKISGYAEGSDETKYMSFLIKDGEL